MIQKLSRAHGAVARFVLNLVIAFILLNLALWPVAALLEVNPVLALYGHEIVYAAYPDREPAEVDALLTETWGRRPTYEPFYQFAEAPHQGRWVNVDPAGFRFSNGPASWPPPRSERAGNSSSRAEDALAKGCRAARADHRARG